MQDNEQNKIKLSKIKKKQVIKEGFMKNNK
jgi:ribosomal protein S4E